MASVVDTSVKHFTDDMVGVPVLSGTAGALIVVLDACLVTGYGVMVAASLVVAGGVATATFASPHAARVRQVVHVDGSSIVALNGEQRVTAKSGNTISWATDAPDGTASGAISVKVAAAGWEKLFSGTNKAVYRSLSPERNGQVVRVDDSGTTVARVVAYESMSDVDTGVNPFPLESQYAGGGRWWKSGVASANAVRWGVFADARFFMVFIAPMSSSNAAHVLGTLQGFGDPIALTPAGDPHSTLIGFNHATAASSANSTAGCLSSSHSTAAAGLASARNVAGTTLSILATARNYLGSTGTGVVSGWTDTQFGTVANSVDGGVMTSRRWVPAAVTTAGLVPRSILPGVLAIPQGLAPAVLSPWDTLDGADRLVGRTLMALGVTPGIVNTVPSTATGVVLVDISGPWR